MGEREDRQQQRRERLDLAAARMKMKLEFMQSIMPLVEFRDGRLRTVTTDADIRATFQDFIDLAAELEDAASAFKCFAD